MSLPPELERAGVGGLVSMGLAAVALVAFATRKPRAGLAAAAGAGLAWWLAHRTVTGYAARLAAAKPVSEVDPAFVDSLPLPQLVN